MSRISMNEFILFLDGHQEISANCIVDYGGEGKVVVLRWALPGSEERTEKKVLFASQSPAMVRAAHNAFTEWLHDYQSI